MVDGTPLNATSFNQFAESIKASLYSKEESLSDSTKSAYALEADAVPDDVFAWIGSYNQHWWMVRRDASYYTKALGELIANLGIMAVPGSSASGYTVYYYDSLSLDENGNFVLGAEKTVVVSYDKYTAANVLKGKYFYTVSNGSVNRDTLYYMPADAPNVTRIYGDTWYYVRGSAQPVSAKYVQDVGEWTYIQSDNRSEYPDSGTVNGFEYKYCGIPFDNAVTSLKIETGSYVGTGTSGESNPNTLTVGFAPKILIVYSVDGLFGGGAGTDHGWLEGFLWTENQIRYKAYEGGYCPISLTGTTFSWYSTHYQFAIQAQQNIAGSTYYYMAIG